jgi:hypothetical protein
VIRHLGASAINDRRNDKETTMEYMILIHGVESFDGPAPGSPEFMEMMGGWMAYNQKLIEAGGWIAGASLQPTPTATTVRKTHGGAATVVDGPFAETKEQFGGFYLISAKDLDEALEWAKAIPVEVGSIEVRPIAFRPDAQ